jgi:hypothetical protein
MCEHIEIPQGADPTNFELPTGLSCNRVAPLQEHHFRYADGPEVSFDLTARALRPPVAAFHTTEPGTGHFDQHIHVTGNLRVWGEDLNVDCMSMRDRTWSNRSDYMGDHLRLLNGYMHGAESESNCWLVMAVGSPDSTAEQGIPEGTGALVRDGTKATIVGGSRKVTNRRDGRPDAIELEFVDELGRNLQVHGEALNHLGTMLNPSIFNWWSLYRWTDAKGTVSYGESQETWIPLSALQRDRYVERASR